MKRLVGNELVAGTAIGILTLVAVGVTQTGAGGAYLFAIGFMAIALGILRAQDSAR